MFAYSRSLLSPRWQVKYVWMFLSTAQRIRFDCSEFFTNKSTSRVSRLRPWIWTLNFIGQSSPISILVYCLANSINILLRYGAGTMGGLLRTVSSRYNTQAQLVEVLDVFMRLSLKVENETI